MNQGKRIISVLNSVNLNRTIEVLKQKRIYHFLCAGHGSVWMQGSGLSRKKFKQSIMKIKLWDCLDCRELLTLINSVTMKSMR